jgi:hypothetical protein
MLNPYVPLLLWILISGCTSLPNGTFNSEQLTSSKGEKIYINSLNWGVTDDYQMSIVSSVKNRLKKRSDSLGVISGLEPFVYTFKNDSLTLYFDRDISYRVKEQFRTIHISYVCLDQSKYRKIRMRAYSNEEYHSVPKTKRKTYPPEMPKPSSD